MFGEMEAFDLRFSVCGLALWDLRTPYLLPSVFNIPKETR